MPRTERQRWLHKQRMRARGMLWGLLARQGDRCYWCGCNLVTAGRARSLLKLVRLPDQDTTVVWREGGKLRTARLATVDHLRPLSEFTRGSHPSASDNLVAACYECNNNRHRTPRGVDLSGGKATAVKWSEG